MATHTITWRSNNQKYLKKYFDSSQYFFRQNAGDHSRNSPSIAVIGDSKYRSAKPGTAPNLLIHEDVSILVIFDAINNPL
jgi:hypothetical protein